MMMAQIVYPHLYGFSLQTSLFYSTMIEAQFFIISRSAYDLIYCLNVCQFTLYLSAVSNVFKLVLFVLFQLNTHI